MRSLLRTLGLRHALRHRTRTLLMVLSVALGVAAWTTTSTLDRTLETALKTSSTPLVGAADFQVHNGDLGVRKTLADRLARVPGVRSVRPIVVQRVIFSDLDPSAAVLLGVDVAGRKVEADALGLTIRDGAPAAFVRAKLRNQVPVLVGGALERALPRGAREFNVLVGGKRRRFVRVGTIEARGASAALGGHVLVTDSETAARLSGKPDLVSRIDVTLTPDADRDRTRRHLEAAATGLGQVLTPEARDRRVLEALDGLRVGFSLCGVGALALGLLMMTSTLAVGVAERRGEIGLLRSLGADRGQVWRLFLSEAAALGIVGATLGVPLGWGLARLVRGSLLAVLSDVFVPMSDEQSLDSRSWIVLGGLALGLATALMAGFLPAARAAALEPVEALAREPGLKRSSSRRRVLIAAACLLGLALAILVFGQHVGPRFRAYGVLALVLLSTLLAIPTAAAGAARLLRPVAERLLGLPGLLAADRLIRSPSHHGLAIAALAGGVALILQTGGVVHGNEQAIRAWVDECVTGDLFVTSGGPLSASGQILPMPEELGARIETEFPGTHAVPIRFRYLTWRKGKHESRVLLLAMEARRYLDAQSDPRRPFPDRELYRRLTEPGTVLVSENFAALEGVKVGDTIDLPGVDGPVPLRVVGTVVDFSCNRGTLMVDRARYRESFGAEGVDVFTLFCHEPSRAEDVARRLQQTSWAADQALCVLTHPELRRHMLGMVERIYRVAYVQEIVAALVAALGVTTALLISVLQRRRELGLLRAVGATPAQAVGMVLAEAVLMTVIGIAFGLLLGAALEWYVLRVVLLEETGFVFPVQFPWGHAALVSAVAALSGLAASLVPAWRVSRLRITEAIACE